MTARIRSIGPETELLAGENVRKIREALGWTRSDLSFQVRLQTGYDLSVATIRSIEVPDRDRRLTLSEAVILARTLEVPVDALTKEIA